MCQEAPDHYRFLKINYDGANNECQICRCVYQRKEEKPKCRDCLFWHSGMTTVTKTTI